MAEAAEAAAAVEPVVAAGVSKCCVSTMKKLGMMRIK